MDKPDKEVGLPPIVRDELDVESWPRVAMTRSEERRSASGGRAGGAGKYCVLAVEMPAFVRVLSANWLVP